MGETMGDAMAAEINTIGDLWTELKRLYPEHRLLAYIKESTPSSVKLTDNKRLSDEFIKEFPPTNPAPMKGAKSSEYKLYSFMRYRKALEEAVAVCRKMATGKGPEKSRKKARDERQAEKKRQRTKQHPKNTSS